MKIFELKIEDKIKQNPMESIPGREDFSHIEGDAEDFIFFFADNKKHSEK